MKGRCSFDKQFIYYCQLQKIFVRPRAIITARDDLKFHMSNSGADPRLEEPELVSDQGKGSGEVMVMGRNSSPPIRQMIETHK